MFLFFLLISIAAVNADYSLSINTSESRGKWKGFGTSLSWWANVVNSKNRRVYADLFFSLNQTMVLDNQTLPGLGLNVVRYNIGGSGRPGDIPGVQEQQSPSNPPKWKMIEGFWKNWNSRDINSDSWDWSRDRNQLRMLFAAKARGVQFVEFFSNAPMWWMTAEKSSAGGQLQSWNYQDFSYYVASVVRYVQQNWRLAVTSLEILNEPSAYWWKFGQSQQEGLQLTREEQSRLLKYLDSEMSSSNLTNVLISASDENSVPDAIATAQFYQQNNVNFNRLNVHGYYGLEPFRDNQAREKLRQVAGDKDIWMSEYGDGDASGESLATSIMQDLNHLKPTAWVYWQALEPGSGWGLLLGDYSNSGSLYQINNKYLIYAHFTRYVRPNDQIIETESENSVAAFDETARILKIVLIGQSQELISINVGISNSNATIVSSSFNDGPKWQSMNQTLVNGTLALSSNLKTIYSISIPL